jgi:hypothetical protein
VLVRVIEVFASFHPNPIKFVVLKRTENFSARRKSFSFRHEKNVREILKDFHHDRRHLVRSEEGKDVVV